MNLTAWLGNILVMGSEKSTDFFVIRERPSVVTRFKNCGSVKAFRFNARGE